MEWGGVDGRRRCVLVGVVLAELRSEGFWNQKMSYYIFFIVHFLSACTDLGYIFVIVCMPSSSSSSFYSHGAPSLGRSILLKTKMFSLCILSFPIDNNNNSVLITSKEILICTRQNTNLKFMLGQKLSLHGWSKNFFETKSHMRVVQTLLR